MARTEATLSAALAYFGMVFGAGFALGVLRTLFVVPTRGSLDWICIGRFRHVVCNGRGC